MWSTHMASLVWSRWKKAAWLLLWCIHGKWGMNAAQFGIWLLGNPSKTPVNVKPPRAARLFWLSLEMQDFKWVEKQVVQGENTSQTPQPLIHLRRSSSSGLEWQDPLINHWTSLESWAQNKAGITVTAGICGIWCQVRASSFPGYVRVRALFFLGFNSFAALLFEQKMWEFQARTFSHLAFCSSFWEQTADFLIKPNDKLLQFTRVTWEFDFLLMCS